MKGDFVDLARELYRKAGSPSHILSKVQEEFTKLNPQILQEVCDNKVEFLSFIGDVCLHRNSISAYTKDIAHFKDIVANFDNLTPEYLNSLTDKGLKYFTFIDFLKKQNSPIIKLYKEAIVEPLVSSCSMLVVKLAKGMKVSVPFEDRIALGFEGLVVAAWRYEPLKGFKFTTYAANWIRQRIFSEIDTGLKIPSQIMMKFHKLKDYYEQYKQEFDKADITGFVEWLKNDLQIPESELLSPDLIKLIIASSSMTSYESLAANYENRTSDELVSEEYSLIDHSFKKVEEKIENLEYIEKFKEIAKGALSDLEFKVFFLLTFGNYKREAVRKLLRLRKVYDVDRLYKRAVDKLRNLFPDKESLINLQPSIGTLNQVDQLL